MDKLTEVKRVRAEADLLFPESRVNKALNQMARAISDELAERNPLLLCVLTGGIIPCAELMQRLDFPLTGDVVHASRYQEATSGAELEWITQPRTPLRNRVVLIVDDILDEGLTLKAIHQYCVEQGAGAVYSAVLIDKMLGREKPYRADFVGIEAENRYLFGCGMDYKGYWRNLPAIYALKES